MQKIDNNIMDFWKDVSEILPKGTRKSKVERTLEDGTLKDGTRQFCPGSVRSHRMVFYPSSGPS